MRTLLTALLTALLVGCTPPVTEGEVQEKVYEPPRTWVSIILVPTGCGKYGCTMMPVPYTMHDDEDWVLNVLGKDGDGDWRMRRFYVTQDYYNRVKVGDYFISHAGYKDDTHDRTKNVGAK